MNDAENMQYRVDSYIQEPWDYRLCRCENNGDLCDYCLRFEDEKLEQGALND